MIIFADGGHRPAGALPPAFTAGRISLHLDLATVSRSERLNQELFSILTVPIT